MSHLPSIPTFSFSVLGFASSPSQYLDPPSAGQEDIDTVIKDVAKAADAEAEKIDAEKAAKGAA